MIDIILFGTNCDLCREIADSVENYISMHPEKYSFEKSMDLHRMLAMGVKSTPALVVHGKITLFHTAPSMDDISAICEGIQR